MTSRVDMHCHSTASQLSRPGTKRSLGLPECATPPEEVYALAKRRGMDFVTITDHDTIAGCLELADRPDCFISEELTARFAGEPQVVHVLCYGITPEDHEWLQAHAGDVEACAAYLDENEIACALAHPFFDPGAPLTPRHRRRLAELFPVWEVRNGSRAAEMNMPAVTCVEARGGIGIAGSDDHSGIDIGRTYTETPSAATPEEFLRHVRSGNGVTVGGEEGSAAKWTHWAMAMAARVLDGEPPRGQGAGRTFPEPAALLGIAQRVIGEGIPREGKVATALGPEDSRRLLAAWLGGVGLPIDGRALLDYLQSDGFSHADLYRRARRAHERWLRAVTPKAARAAADGGDLAPALSALCTALAPVAPYAPSTTFLAREKAKLARREEGPARVAVVADGIGSTAAAVAKIRERGVPGFEVEVIGADASVDRRLPAPAELELPGRRGLKIAVPALPDLVETLAEGGYDVIHVTAPGPAGLAAALIARVSGARLIASHHPEVSTQAGPDGDGDGFGRSARAMLGAFYRAAAVVLAPNPAADRSLAGLGVDPSRIARWEGPLDQLAAGYELALRRAPADVRPPAAQAA